MEKTEMIQKLMEKADVTYEEAKGVLDAVNWNLLDALIALEKEGKIKEKAASSYSTRQDMDEEIENIRNTGEPEAFKDVMKRFFNRVRIIAARGMDIRFRINKTDGSEIVGLPVTVFAVLLIISLFTGLLTAVIIALVICFFCGCTFSFEGEDSVTEKLNSHASKIKFTGGKKDSKDNDISINDKK